MEHGGKPKKSDECPQEILSLLHTVMHSPYVAKIQKEVGAVRGRIVSSAQGGTSGYLLTLHDGSHLIAFLDGEKMDMIIGKGFPPEKDIALINSEKCGDASAPLTVNLPYADEPCFIDDEVKNCREMMIEGVSLGENTFNLCFPDGWELDASIVPDPEGKKALRIFWEQW